MPYDDAKGREIAQKLYRRFRVSTLPQLVLLNEEGGVVNPQAYASMLMNPADFPWKKKTIKELLGDTLLQHDGKLVSKVRRRRREKRKKKRKKERMREINNTGKEDTRKKKEERSEKPILLSSFSFLLSFLFSLASQSTHGWIAS